MAKGRTTLQEDFEALGVPIEAVLGEQGVSDAEEEDVKDEEDKGAEGEEEEKTEDQDSDPIDGVYVTKELFDRIGKLPFDAMEEADYEDLLSELSEKKLPDGDDELREQAERVVVMLKEGIASRQRRFKSGSTARKVSFQCPQGQRAVKVGGGGGRPQCRPAHVAAGGMGKLRKESRKKKKWGRGGKGTMSKMRSGRVEKRRTAMRSEGLVSPFARELMQVSEGIQEEMASSVRDDIIERIVTIFELLNEEFLDASVAQIYEESVDEMLDAYESGRLEEDVMDDNDFIAELEPVISLITKSLEKLEDDSGND